MFTLSPRSRVCLWLVAIFVSSLPAEAQLLTAQIGTPAQPPATIVAHGETWRWHRGTNEPQSDWRTAPDVDLDATWNSGPGGFGYGDAAIQGEGTALTGMRNVHSTLYVRREFTVTNAINPVAQLQLKVDYDDGFVAYLDGVELRRANLAGASNSPVAPGALAMAAHEASCCTAPVNPATTFDQGLVATRLAPGIHVLAFVIANDDTNSSDLHLIPDLLVSEPPENNDVVDQGHYAVSTTNSLLIPGSNTVAGSARVTVNGEDANFDSTNGVWTRQQSLTPGMNRLYIAALDASGNVLSNILKWVVYETSRVTAGGTLASNLSVSNAGTVLYVTNSIVVPTNVTFEAANGAVVLVPPGRSIIAQNGGRIFVRGTFEQNVFFNVFGPNTANWGPLSATGTNSTLDVQFADVAHSQTSATTGAHGLLQDVRLHDFDPGGAAGTLNRPIMMCNYAVLFEARRLHVWNYYEMLVRNGVIQVEHGLFEEVVGDALDFDSAQPGSFVRRTTFRHGTRGNVDAVDIGPGDLPGSTDTRIEDCIMWNFPFDKGVSVGDQNSSHGIIVSNCLIYGCNSGVMAKDLCDVSVRNCTIIENGCGFTNYNKANQASPTGGGIITNAFNNIVWNNVSAIGMANGGQLFGDHNVFGNTNWPGEANIDVDPLFVNEASRDFRLQSNSPCLTAGRDGTYMGVTYPLGGIPAEPLRLAALTPSNGAPMLTWIDDSQNEDGVVVQRSSNGSAWQTIATLPAGSTNYSDGTAAFGQRSFYRVQHTNYVGMSPFSNITIAERSTASADGLVLEIASPIAAGVPMQFDAQSNLSYTIQSRTSFSTGAWTRLDDVAPAPTNRTHSFTNPASDPARFFRVVTPQQP
jgi:hypothetical protein